MTSIEDDITINNPAIGSNWEDVRKELYTPEEIEESNLRVALIGKLIKAIEEKKIIQKEFEELLKIHNLL